MTYAITGASGQLGRLTAAQLLQRVDPAEVVLFSRTPAALAEFAERGVTVRPLDFADPASLPEAFAGVDRLLLISTDAVGVRLEQQRGAIDAAKAAGVQHVLYTSVPGTVEDNPAMVVPDHLGTEEHLRASGLGWTFLRNNLYADLQLDGLRHAAQSGQLVTNAGDGVVAYVTRADCAAAAAGALASETTDAAYDITGPHAYSSADLAAIAARIGGKPVEVVDVDDAAYTAGLVGAGLPEPFAELLASFGASAREGFLADVTTAVHDLAGVEPAALDTLLQDRPGSRTHPGPLS